ncbi:unnamed protein product [Ectocarpus sp. 12 AP-2014]
MEYHCSMSALEILPTKDDDHRSVMYLSLFLIEVLKVNAWYRSNGGKRWRLPGNFAFAHSGAA